ncbi:MAG: hypothetical protein JW937_07030 [Candidatus Omnitrophica bacterium]|nr:hypothetical protein [Candidatus Omnitrophota bacterium]
MKRTQLTVRIHPERSEGSDAGHLVERKRSLRNKDRHGLCPRGDGF